MKKTVIGILIALAALGVLTVIGFVLFLLLLRAPYNITHEDTWEQFNGSGYSITLPPDLEKGDASYTNTAITTIDSYYNSQCQVIIGHVPMTKQEVKISKRIDLFSLVKNYFPVKDQNGNPINIQERGEMAYAEYLYTYESQDLMVLEGIYLGSDGMYEVEIHCLADSYDDYKEYFFMWLDSFVVY